MFTEPLRDVSDALRAGDRARSWTALQPLLNYPTGLELSDPEWAQSLGMLTIIGNDTLSPEVKSAVADVRAKPTDVQALYALGYRLTEVRMPRIAASALARGNALSPDVPALVNDLATALVSCGMRNHAYQALQDAYGARQRDWTSRYLYAFNALLSGHVDEARQAFAEIGEPRDQQERAQQDSLRTMLGRIDKLGAQAALAADDLRSWHHVLTGGLLTHLSPSAADDKMHGRYGRVHDSDALIHEGLIRSLAVMRAWEVHPTQIYYSRDRSSEILARVWNQRIGISIKAFDEGDTELPGIFMAYDLAEATKDFVRAQQRRGSDQILITHAHEWSIESDFTSDITTYHYQRNTSPWGEGRLLVNPATQVPEEVAVDQADAEQIAKRIASAAVPKQALSDLGELDAFASSCRAPVVGQRDRFYVGSHIGQTA